MLETTFSESSPFIMMLVDRDMRVRRVNRVGADFTGRPKEALLELLCGEVVHCVNSVDGLGCGRNAVCGECLVRSQVLHTLRTGEAVYEAQGKFVVIRESGESTLDMLVSTARFRSWRNWIPCWFRCSTSRGTGPCWRESCKPARSVTGCCSRR